MKMSIIYHTRTGNTARMAEIIAQGMESVPGVEAKCFNIDRVNSGWLKDSQCIVVGSPTYYASISGELKVFLESMGKYDPAGKLGGAFATANYIHGGGELAIQCILDHMLVYGMLVYSGGSSCGKPVIHLGPEAVNGKLQEVEDVFFTYGQRMAKKAVELFK